MPRLFDRTQVGVSGTPGTGTITLGSATSGYRDFATAGVPTGANVRYLIVDGTAWEIGKGVYTSAGTTLTRGLIASSTGSLISLTSSAIVSIVQTALDVPPISHFTRLTADRAGSNVATAQAIFAATEDTFTAEAGGVYNFELVIGISRTAGTTSHTIGFLFGGTATLTSIAYRASASQPTGNILGADAEIWGVAATSTVLTAANAIATEDVRIMIKGILEVNAAGTLIPQVIYSVAPGGAPTFRRGSYCRFDQMNVNAGAAAIGDWG